MQSNQFKSDSVDANLNLNATVFDSTIVLTGKELVDFNRHDTSVIDSMNVNYIAPDSLIYMGYRPEWTQFRTAWKSDFDYQKELVHQLPYDSLHTVLKKVEVVFPGKKMIRSNPDWLIGVLVLAFLLFASVRLIFNKYLSQILQSTLNYSTFLRMFRERYFNLLHASFRLDVIFSLVLALFSYQFLSAFKINLGFSGSLYVYLACLGLVVGYFIIKRIIYFILGVLTESKAEVQEYLFSINVFNRALGLFLLPVTVAIAFVPLSQVELMLFIGLGIIAIFYLMSLIRGGKIFLKKHFSISYLILYLCTLEFLPLFLIYNLLLI
jgi:hypothetical protein